MRTPERWTELVHLRITGRDTMRPRINKITAHKVLAESGVRVPKRYRTFDAVHHIRFLRLPREFVLKPTLLNGKRGVMLLSANFWRTAFHEDMTDRTLSRTQILDEQNGWNVLQIQRRKTPLQWIAEERIFGENGRDEIPYDYKVYVFNGEPKLVLQIDRNGPSPRYSFFDGNFLPMRENDDRISLGIVGKRGKAIVPRCAKQILASASAVSITMKTPFVSVDCFASFDGEAIVGEITTAPGGPYAKRVFQFSDAFDHELGGAWLKAADDLGQSIAMYDDVTALAEGVRTSGLPTKLPQEV